LKKLFLFLFVVLLSSGVFSQPVDGSEIDVSKLLSNAEETVDSLHNNFADLFVNDSIAGLFADNPDAFVKIASLGKYLDRLKYVDRLNYIDRIDIFGDFDSWLASNSFEEEFELDDGKAYRIKNTEGFSDYFIWVKDVDRGEKTAKVDLIKKRFGSTVVVSDDGVVDVVSLRQFSIVNCGFPDYFEVGDSFSCLLPELDGSTITVTLLDVVQWLYANPNRINTVLGSVKWSQSFFRDVFWENRWLNVEFAKKFDGFTVRKDSGDELINSSGLMSEDSDNYVFSLHNNVTGSDKSVSFLVFVSGLYSDKVQFTVGYVNSDNSWLDLEPSNQFISSQFLNDIRRINCNPGELWKPYLEFSGEEVYSGKNVKFCGVSGLGRAEVIQVEVDSINSDGKTVSFKVRHVDVSSEFKQIARIFGEENSSMLEVFGSQKMVDLFLKHPVEFRAMVEFAKSSDDGRNSPLKIAEYTKNMLDEYTKENNERLKEWFNKMLSALSLRADNPDLQADNSNADLSEIEAFYKELEDNDPIYTELTFFYLNEDISYLFVVYPDDFSDIASFINSKVMNSPNFNGAMLQDEISNSAFSELSRPLELLDTMEQRKEFVSLLTDYQVLGLLSLETPDMYSPSSNHLLFDRLKELLDEENVSVDELLVKYNLIDAFTVNETYKIYTGKNFLLRAILYDRFYGKENSLLSHDGVAALLPVLLEPLDSSDFTANSSYVYGSYPYFFNAYFLLLADGLDKIKGIPGVSNQVKLICERRLNEGIADDELRAGFEFILYLVDNDTKLVSEEDKAFIRQLENEKRIYDSGLYSNDGKITVLEVFSKETDEESWFLTQDWLNDYFGKKPVVVSDKGLVYENELGYENKLVNANELVYENDNAKVILFMSPLSEYAIGRGKIDNGTEGDWETRNFIKRRIQETPNVILANMGSRASYWLRDKFYFKLASPDSHVLFISNSERDPEFVSNFIRTNQGADFRLVTDSNPQDSRVANAVVQALLESDKKPFKQVFADYGSLISENGGNADTITVSSNGELLFNYVLEQTENAGLNK